MPFLLFTAYLKGVVFSLIPIRTHYYWLIAIASKFSGLSPHVLLLSIIFLTTAVCCNHQNSVTGSSFFSPEGYGTYSKMWQSPRCCANLWQSLSFTRDTKSSALDCPHVPDCRNGMDSLPRLSWGCSPEFLTCVQYLSQISTRTLTITPRPLKRAQVITLVIHSAQLSFLMVWRVNRFIRAMRIRVSLLCAVHFYLSPKPNCTSNTVRLSRTRIYHKEWDAHFQPLSAKYNSWLPQLV